MNQPKAEQEVTEYKKLLEEYTQAVTHIVGRIESEYEGKLAALRKTIYDLHEAFQAYEALAANDVIQDGAAKAGLTLEQYLSQEMHRLARCADYPLVPVDKGFWEHVEVIAAGVGLEPESIMISSLMTQRLLSLVDNQMILD